jgi:feruloyl esterase
MKLTGIAAAAALAAAVAPGLARAAAVDPCAAALKLPAAHVTVTRAETTPAGSSIMLDRDAPEFKAPVAFCWIVGVSRPTPDSEIGFEIWIPEGKAWNGKFVQMGNGGFAGAISHGLMTYPLLGGYAVAATDDGHRAASGSDASFALRHPEKVKDFGYRALRETTLAARAALAAYQRRPPERSYFFGCSDGGREALMEAQRYPNDFDGIVAMAPANAMTRLLGGFGMMQKPLFEPGRLLAPAKLDLLERAALKDCGGGLDYIRDPQACRFDPAALACAPGAANGACLTPGEVETARLVYRGVTGPDGYAYPGLTPGAEAEKESWATWVMGEPAAPSQWSAFAQGYFADMVREDPAFDLRKVSFADAEAGWRKLSGVLDSTNPDLSAFRAHGGKLIQVHGWNDPAISPVYSLRYYDSVRMRMGDPSGFYRLYMVPGMLHCAGGAGPSQVDWLALLDGWVAQGKAPEEVTAGDAKGASQTLKPWGR